MADPAQEKADSEGAEKRYAFALGLFLLLPLILWGYLEFGRAPKARASRDLKNEVFAKGAPAATADVAPTAGDMPAPENQNRMLLGPSAGAAAPALTPTAASDSHTASIQSSSLELDVADPDGRLGAIAVEVNDLQVNRYALRSTPSQKVMIPLPDLPVYKFTYKAMGKNGKLLSKGDIAFLRSGEANVSPPQFDPQTQGTFQIGVTYHGPYRVTGQ